MHPLFEYMVGDTVSNVVDTGKTFRVTTKKFIIKEAMQIFVGNFNKNEREKSEIHYRGHIKNLSNHLFDEDELCTCRMVLIEKNKLFKRNG